MNSLINVALIGNPNTGKTSIFNQLTGLNQKVGNYPGITVDKKLGKLMLGNKTQANLLDLPGVYSITPVSDDEKIAVNIFTKGDLADKPDIVIVVADVTQLRRNLLLFTQVKDLKIPTILVINMADMIKKNNIDIDIKKLEKELNTKIVLTSAKDKQGIEELKSIIENYKDLNQYSCVNDNLSNELENSDYTELPKHEQTKFKEKRQKETILRYQFIDQVLKNSTFNTPNQTKISPIDQILTHHIFGYIIFFIILGVIFQAMFAWSSIPMDWIDLFFSNLSGWAQSKLPDGPLTDLLSEGIIAGIGGIVIFIPQITFLFLFITILEESGYMSRVVFIMDKFMRKFGLSGKSVVPLISGTACAIPGIMAARNIESFRERLITILVAPFMTCSARLPVYAILISLAVPDKKIFNIFGYQGITLMFLYLLGFLGVIFSAYILHRIFKIKGEESFVIELPSYQVPIFRNVLQTVYEKVKIFIINAGRIILAISIILWVLASFGPGDDFSNASNIVENQIQAKGIVIEDNKFDDIVASYKLEHSYIGIMGRAIEPVIRPLGYDWKIGVALITSFAAREVFIGSLATIYSVGSSEDENTIKERIQNETDPKTGDKVFDFATSMSLLIFYVFAMQCMSTLAIVQRETNSWRWPAIQFTSMTAIAYLSALLTYQVLS